MNPTASPNQPLQDASGPVPGPNAAADTLSPDLVSDIPVRAQGSSPAADDELDKIMQDVGQQLKNEDQRPSKKHRSFFGRHPKNRPEAKLHAQPLPPVTAQPPPAASQNRPPLPKSAAAQPQPSTTSSAPILVITLTIIVTGILIVAAIYAYKK